MTCDEGEVTVAATEVDQGKPLISEVRAQAVALAGAISEAVEEAETPTLDRFLACDVVAGALVRAMCGWTVRRLAGRLARPAQPPGAGHVTAG
jgi:hypothetical protein